MPAWTRSLLALLALATVSSTGAAQGIDPGGGAVGGGVARVVSPFFPSPGGSGGGSITTPPTGGGGQFTPPGDQGVPGGGAGAGDGGVSQPAGGASGGGGGRTSRGGAATGAIRGGAPARAAAVTSSTVRDSWIDWWETNKFDFIELRRVRDAPITGQGRVEESEDALRERLSATDRLVRAEVLPVLRELTRTGDTAVRASAVVSLAKLQDDQGADVARALLRDRSFEVRRASMLAMGVLETGRSSYLLMNIADDSALGRSLLDTGSISDEDRGVALLTAALRGDPAPSALVERLLQEPDDLPNEILAAACDAAGLLGSVECIPALTAIALDKGRAEFVRASGATALGRLGDPGTIPALLRILDASQEPKRAAVVALGLVGHRGLPEVVDRLAGLLDDTDGPTRHFAAVSLGRIGGDRARAALSASFATPRTDMRPWLALGLGLCERADPRGDVPVLLAQRLEKESNVETAGAYLIALGLCGDQGAGRPEGSWPWETVLEALAGALDGKNTQLAAQAALGLGLTGHPDAGTLLAEALSRTDNPEVQRHIALGLGVLGRATAVPQLLQLMRTTKNPFVASSAALGIAFMGDADAIGPLLRMIEKSGTTGVTTTYAVVAMGQLLDDERRPVLSRLAAGDNYLARPSSVRQLLTLGF